MDVFFTMYHPEKEIALFCIQMKCRKVFHIIFDH